MVASFFDRLGAYVIDMIIISILISVISFGVPSNDSSEINAKMNELQDKLINGEVDNDVILTEYGNLLYEYQKSNVIYMSVNVALYIAYFVVFQYMLKGQTLGKKVLKLKVVTNEDGNVTIWQMIIRYLFIVSIFSGIMDILLVFLLKEYSYMITYVLLSLGELVFVFASMMFILYRKDKRGLHDVMAGTKVIKEV